MGNRPFGVNDYNFPNWRDPILDRRLGEGYRTVEFVYDNWDKIEQAAEAIEGLPPAVWTFDPADYATAAQGLKADSAVQPAALSNVAFTGLYNSLSGRPTLGSAADKDVTYFASAAQGAKADTALQPSHLGVANGAASLGADGKIPNGQLPALAITETYVVNSEAAQLALDAQEGDVAIRTDLGKSYIHTNSYVGTMLDWQELLTPTAPVLSVNGQTGAVVLTASNIAGSMDLSSAQSVSGVKTYTAAPVLNAGMTVADTQGVRLGSGGAQFYGSSQGIAVLAIGGQAGSLMLFRPKGRDSATSQTSMNENGAWNFGAKTTHTLGARFADEQLLEMGSGGGGLRGTATGSTVLFSGGAATGGLVIIRPNGNTGTNAQTIFNTDGTIEFGGTAGAKTVTRRNLGVPISIATAAPAGPTTGDIWIDTSVSPMALKRWNGTAWVT